MIGRCLEAAILITNTYVEFGAQSVEKIPVPTFVWRVLSSLCAAWVELAVGTHRFLNDARAFWHAQLFKCIHRLGCEDASVVLEKLKKAPVVNFRLKPMRGEECLASLWESRELTQKYLFSIVNRYLIPVQVYFLPVTQVRLQECLIFELSD